MINNYFKSAWRSIKANKFYSALNICGLAIGLATGIMLLLWVQDEFSYDKFNKNLGNIYRINCHFAGQDNGGKEVVYGVTAPSLSVSAKSIPGVESIVRILPNGSQKFSTNDQTKPLDVNGTAYVDSSFLRIFGFPLLQGNRDNIFPDPYSIVITAAVADKFFHTRNALGRVLIYDGQTFTVTGVLKDFAKKSTQKYNVLLPMAYYNTRFVKSHGDRYKSIDENYNNYSFLTYVLLQPKTDKDKIATAFTLANAKAIGDKKADHYIFRLQSLKNIRLIEPAGNDSAYRMVQIFLLVAVLLLLVAGINYVNLSTARVLTRVKEITVRKIVGAGRKQLFFQFMAETTLLFMIAMGIAIGLIFSLMPLYNSLSGKNLAFNLSDSGVWWLLGLSITGTLLMSGIYPAVLLSSFSPLQGLKGKPTAGVGTVMFRKLLVIFQFGISVALIFATIVISRQMHFVREINLGYNNSYVFASTFPDAALAHLPAIKSELLKQKSISDVGASVEGDFTNLDVTTSGIHWKGKDENKMFMIYQTSVDADFIPTMKLQFLEGHNFTGTPIDTTSFMLNETAVKQMGLKPPYVGQRIGFHDRKGVITGILKDFNFQSLKTAVAPLILYSYAADKNTLYVRTTAKDAQAAIAAVSRLYRQYEDNNVPFSYNFLDKLFEAQFQSDLRTGRLFTIFAAIAIIISCLGLFGLATYTAQVKTKEIGIRKVLGASVGNIVRLISKDFLLLVIIAIVIAIPVTYWMMNRWLQDFAYRTAIGVFPFALSAVIVILIAFATIGFKAFNSAHANPVKSLKTE